MKENELHLIAAELLRREQEERCQFFVPNGKQQQFIKGVGEGKHKIFLFCASNAIGKDTVACNILANIFWGPQNEWFRGLPLFENWPYPKYVRFVTESQLVKETGPMATEIRKWWPLGKYEAKNAGKQFPSEYHTDTGFYMDVMTYEQDPAEFEGVTVGCFVFSEPPPEDIYNRCISRLRQGGIIIIVMTPMFNAGWVLDRLMDAKDAYVLSADIEDGCKIHGVRGHLDHDQIQWMISKWPPEEVAARAHGKFMHLSNTVYGAVFNRQYHVVPDSTPTPEGSKYGMVIDPASGKPFAIGWYSVSPNGQVMFEDEYPNQDFTKMRDTKMVLKDYVELFKAKEEGREMEWRIIDRHFANARDYRGMTLRQELAEKYGLIFQNSYSMDEEIETGILGVKKYLRFDETKPISSLNYPKLIIKERCRNIIRAMERWGRDRDTFKPETDSPYKDHADLIRYVCMSQPEIYTPRPLSPPKPRYAPGA